MTHPVTLKVMYRVIDGLAPWAGQYVPGHGVISNGNFTEEQIKILEASGLRFTVTDKAPPLGVDLVNEGFIPAIYPEQIDPDGWEQSTGKVPGGPPGLASPPKKVNPVIVPVVPVKP